MIEWISRCCFSFGRLSRALTFSQRKASPPPAAGWRQAAPASVPSERHLSIMPIIFSLLFSSLRDAASFSAATLAARCSTWLA